MEYSQKCGVKTMIELFRKEDVMNIIKDQLAEITKGQKHCVEQCKLVTQAIGFRVEKLPVIILSEEENH